MPAVIFDGKKLAFEITKELEMKVAGLNKKKGRRLKLVTIYNPDHEPSRVYSNIKQKKAEEIGVEFEKVPVGGMTVEQISRIIGKLNLDLSVDGVMVQLPLGTANDKELIDQIDPKKDVDGLRANSVIVPATVRAVLKILGELSEQNNSKVLVVGNLGLVGARLQKELGCEGMDKHNFDSEKIKSFYVVIGCTGEAGLIKAEMVKQGVVAIDVGYPVGDFEPDVADSASFLTPVPGGVGPVTVAMLFANLVDLVSD